MIFKQKYGKNRYFSISKELRKQQRSTDEFEIMLNNLTLEELISLKLELSSKIINHKLYGFKIYQNISNIVRDAVFKYSLSATQSLNDAARFLGMSKHNFKKLYKKYNIII